MSGDLVWHEDVLYVPRQIGEPQQFYTGCWQLVRESLDHNVWTANVAWITRSTTNARVYELSFYDPHQPQRMPFRSLKLAKAYAVAIAQLTN